MNTKDLQTEIKLMIGRLKWTQKRLAREIYTETHEYDNDMEIRRFEESLKKDLYRESTKPERLMEYIKIISRHEEFKKLELIVPVYVSTATLSPLMEDGMKSISSIINMLLDEE